VCVEIKFYLLAPLLVKHLNKYVLLVFILAVIALSAAFRIEHFTQPHYYHYHPLAFSDMLAIGALLAWMANFVPSFVQKIRLIPAWLTLVPYLLTIGLVLSRKWIYSHGEWAEWIVSIEPILVSLIFAGIIAEQNFAEKSVLKFGNWNRIRYLGVRTYGVYGFHLFFLFLVIAIFQLAGWHKQQNLNNWVYLAEIVSTFVLTLLASIWFYNKVELPIMKGTFLKRKS
jgi:peptidoglycan/LPS O-acetylase OafA/YrhL